MKVLAVSALILLAGCGFTPQGDAARAAIREGGAQAFDEGLVNAEWFICQAASVGSIKRRYGISAEKAEAYNALCDNASAENIVAGP